MNRILIVDDEPLLLHSYRRIFRLAHYKLLCVTSGEEALLKVVDFMPDIILLDIIMPGMDGYAVCEELKKIDCLKNTDIIFVSGKSSLEDRLRAYQLRASDYLIKPVSEDELLAKVALILEKKRFYLELTTTDPLTLVGNRKYFDEKFATIYRIASQYKRMFSFAILDIDHFKRINDLHGHNTGDVTLKQVAERISNKIRKSDLLARIGGEEFAVLMTDTNEKNAQRVLERLRLSVSEQVFTYPGNEQLSLTITISIGFAIYPEHAIEKDEIYHQADRALYLAKQNGRNRVESAGVFRKN